MRLANYLLLSCAMLAAAPAFAEEEAAEADNILVTGERIESAASTKTDVPAIEVPQPVTVVTAETYLAQGAISISDTLAYVAGVQANPYGPDSRVDGGFVRGVDALQFRDGMRDLYSYYASIRSDPYNFSQVELVRGPASVLFGSGSLGGLVNMVSKAPQFDSAGEVSLVYGSHDRKEVLADVTGPVSDTLAYRLVGRLRDSGTQTDYVPDDRVMLAPSLTFAPSTDTDVTLIGLYQEDDGGSTAQFLPVVGTLYDNPNGKLPNNLFIGKPGWDRYDGRLLEGTAIANHRFSDHVKLSLKARYIDSDLTYLTHYPDSYGDPTNPYLDADQRIIGLYSDGSKARMNVFSTDNNLRFDFNTGGDIEHILLAGADYSWNKIHKEGGFDYEFIDIYDIDYDALSDYGGTYPLANFYTEDTKGSQLGFYLQDQIRLWDRVSVVVGARRDHVTAEAAGSAKESWNHTSLRAGIIGELVKGVSPFFSYTESFEPLTGMGLTSTGTVFKPQQGKQFEAGIKFQPDARTMATLTFYHIEQTNRPVDDPSTPDPFDSKQAGVLVSKGFEIEATRSLPGNYEIIAAFSHNTAQTDHSGVQVDDVPKTNASLWATKTIVSDGGVKFRFGAGIRYIGAHESASWAFPEPVVTPSVTLVDALVEARWKQWGLAINATNLFDETYYSACLGRGDCFMGADRNVMATLSYRY